MDPLRFDRLTKALSSDGTRRGLLRQLSALAFPLTALGPPLVIASESAKRRHRTLHQHRGDRGAQVHDEKSKKKKKKKKKGCATTGQTPQSRQACCAGLVQDGAGRCAQPAPPSCAQSCTGCCLGETCVTTTSSSACGAGGIACGVCSGLQATCFNGSCRCDVCADGCRYATVQEAIADPSGPTTITVCAGTYSGNIFINRSVTLIGAGHGAGAGNTILQGTGSGSMVIVNSGSVVTLQGLRITGGAAGSSAGGGILNFGRLTLTDCAITGNSAAVGGGIYNLSTADSVEMTRCVITENTADFGGGIFNGGSFTIDAGTVTLNSATSIGGGIVNAVSAHLTVTNTSISDNAAQFGGGLSNNGTLSLENSRVELNSASANGGGIYNEDGTTTLRRTHVVLNSAADGGGIYEVAGEVTRINSVVSGNSPNNCAPSGAVPGCSG